MKRIEEDVQKKVPELNIDNECDKKKQKKNFVEIERLSCEGACVFFYLTNFYVAF